MVHIWMLNMTMDNKTFFTIIGIATIQTRMHSSNCTFHRLHYRRMFPFAVTSQCSCIFKYNYKRCTLASRNQRDTKPQKQKKKIASSPTETGPSLFKWPRMPELWHVGFTGAISSHTNYNQNAKPKCTSC